MELLPGKGGQLVRAAGTSATLVSRGKKRARLIKYACQGVFHSRMGQACVYKWCILVSGSFKAKQMADVVLRGPRCSVQPLTISAWVAGTDGYAVVRLPSGTQRRVLASCSATVGVLSNPQHKNRKLGKAGASRWSGRRPVVGGKPQGSLARRCIALQLQLGCMGSTDCLQLDEQSGMEVVSRMS